MNTTMNYSDIDKVRKLVTKATDRLHLLKEVEDDILKLADLNLVPRKYYNLVEDLGRSSKVVASGSDREDLVDLLKILTSLDVLVLVVTSEVRQLILKSEWDEKLPAEKALVAEELATDFELDHKVIKVQVIS